MITTFSGSRPAYGETTQRNSAWNGDESTLGAPGEDPEYGAGDPERVLELVPGSGFISTQKGFSSEDNGVTQVHPLTRQTNHHVTHSTDSSSSFI
jgi:hypothetical protein